MTQPVLETIRAILKFKNFTTIAEIASTAGISRKSVLNVINDNGQFVKRDRSNGRITDVNVRGPLQTRLWESGLYYKQSSYGAWSKEGECLEFHGNPELKDRLQNKVCVGAFGDSYYVSVIHDTPENRKQIEAEGLTPWEQVTLDDRLWTEGEAS